MLLLAGPYQRTASRMGRTDSTPYAGEVSVEIGVRDFKVKGYAYYLKWIEVNVKRVERFFRFIGESPLGVSESKCQGYAEGVG